MSSKPVIAILGASEAHGAALMRTIEEDTTRRFEARAVVREPGSPSLASLISAGVDVRYGDPDDSAALTAAFAGAYGVYAATNFWEHRCPERELAQVYNIAAAARLAGVRHIVRPTLEDTRIRAPLTDRRLPTTQGRFKVPHMDAKGESDAFLRDLPTTYLRSAFQWDDLVNCRMLRRDQVDGTVCLPLPIGERKLPGIAGGDIGACAFGIFARGMDLVGQTVGIAGEHLTGSEMARALSNVLEEPVRYVPTSEPNLELRAQHSVEFSRTLYSGLRSFREWLEVSAGPIVRHAIAQRVHPQNNPQQGVYR